MEVHSVDLRGKVDVLCHLPLRGIVGDQVVDGHGVSALLLQRRCAAEPMLHDQLALECPMTILELDHERLLRGRGATRAETAAVHHDRQNAILGDAGGILNVLGREDRVPGRCGGEGCANDAGIRGAKNRRHVDGHLGRGCGFDAILVRAG